LRLFSGYGCRGLGQRHAFGHDRLLPTTVNIAPVGEIDFVGQVAVAECLGSRDAAGSGRPRAWSIFLSAVLRQTGAQGAEVDAVHFLVLVEAGVDADVADKGAVLRSEPILGSKWISGKRRREINPYQHIGLINY